MTVAELREELEYLSDDAEVRIASIGHRSHFAYTISDFAVVDNDEDGEVLYLEEGTQLGYLSSEARAELGV